MGRGRGNNEEGLQCDLRCAATAEEESNAEPLGDADARAAPDRGTRRITDARKRLQLPSSLPVDASSAFVLDSSMREAFKGCDLTQCRPLQRICNLRHHRRRQQHHYRRRRREQHLYSQDSAFFGIAGRKAFFPCNNFRMRLSKGAGIVTGVHGFVERVLGVEGFVLSRSGVEVDDGT